MIRRQSNIEEVFVAKDVAVTATRNTYWASQLAEGEIAVFLPGGTVADTTTVLTSNFLYIGMNSSNGELLMSDVIDVRTVKNYVGKVSVADAEQLDYIGYNGTTGDIDAQDSETYLLNLWFKGGTINSFQDHLIKFGVAYSDSSATSEEIAADLANNLASNLESELEHRVKVERVCSGAQTAVPTSADNFVFTNGSKYFTATDIDDNTGTAALAVGDVLVIGTAATSPVYTITAIDTATNIGTFDTKYRGTSQTLADTALKVIVTALTAAASWGIKLTGVQKTWKVGVYPWDKVSWTNELEGFGSTPETNSTVASVGVGQPEQVEEAEWFAQGNEGGDSRYRTRGDAPAYTPRRDTETAHYYSTLSFTHSHSYSTSLGAANNSPKQMVVFLNSGGTVATGVSATSITDSGTLGFMECLDAAVAAATSETAQLANV